MIWVLGVVALGLAGIGVMLWAARRETRRLLKARRELVAPDFERYDPWDLYEKRVMRDDV